MEDQQGVPEMVLTSDPSQLDCRYEWAEVTCMDDFPLRRFVPTQIVAPTSPTSPAINWAFDDYEF